MDEIEEIQEIQEIEVMEEEVLDAIQPVDVIENVVATIPRASATLERRRSRLFSQQPIIEEDILDNEVNNSQQQFENDLNEVSDRLFEEYMQENEEEEFDTELPTNHAYLGQMDPVPGVYLFEVGKVYQLPIRDYHSIIFPGESKFSL